VLDRSVVGYQLAKASAEGQSFEFSVPDLPAAKWRRPDGQLQALPVQVDLVNGAVVWYTIHSFLVPMLRRGTENGCDQGK
jgi:hypothetical protein